MDSKPIIFGCAGSSPAPSTLILNQLNPLSSDVRVQVPPAALCTENSDIVLCVTTRNLKAFIIGVALGDGNLSNPNGKAIRLRITCDSKYQDVIKEITGKLRILFPGNKVSLVQRKDRCVDVSVYSIMLAELLPWKVNHGTKYDQQAHVPDWIYENPQYIKSCLRGLILSDGSIYYDRKYLMVNVCTNIKPLAQDVLQLAKSLGYTGTLSITDQPSGRMKYTVRFARNTQQLLQTLRLTTKS